MLYIYNLEIEYLLLCIIFICRSDDNSGPCFRAFPKAMNSTSYNRFRPTESQYLWNICCAEICDSCFLFFFKETNNFNWNLIELNYLFFKAEVCRAIGHDRAEETLFKVLQLKRHASSAAREGLLWFMVRFFVLKIHQYPNQDVKIVHNWIANLSFCNSIWNLSCLIFSSTVLFAGYLERGVFSLHFRQPAGNCCGTKRRERWCQRGEGTYFLQNYYR